MSAMTSWNRWIERSATILNRQPRRRVRGIPPSPRSIPPPLDYTGEYAWEGAHMVDTMTRKGDKLYIQTTGDDMPTEIVPQSPDTFSCAAASVATRSFAMPVAKSRRTAAMVRTQAQPPPIAPRKSNNGGGVAVSNPALSTRLASTECGRSSGGTKSRGADGSRDGLGGE